MDTVFTAQPAAALGALSHVKLDDKRRKLANKARKKLYRQRRKQSGERNKPIDPPPLAVLAEQFAPNPGRQFRRFLTLFSAQEHALVALLDDKSLASLLAGLAWPW